MLRRGVTDSSPAVRERTLRGISSLPALWSGRAATHAAALGAGRRHARPAPAGPDAGVDQGPASGAGPTPSSTSSDCWSIPTPRSASWPSRSSSGNRLLAGTEKEAAKSSALARRVKALAADPALESARSACSPQTASTRPPWSADVALGRSRLLSFSTFRKKVNPLFYQAGDDQARLRELPRQPHDPAHRRGRRRPRGFSGEQLMINYNSALKVVNLGEPEASLILRKPRSPHGAGGADPSSPTGLTHVGGTPLGKHRVSGLSSDPRLDSRSVAIGRGPCPGRKRTRPTATRPATSRPWPATATSRRSGTPSSSAPAPATRTSWSSTWARLREVEGLLYVPRQDSPNGRVRDFEIRTSADGQSWGSHSPRAAGKTTRRSNMCRSPARRPATFSSAA